MRATFQAMCRIAIEHAYFSRGGCPALAMTPHGRAVGTEVRLQSSPGRGTLFATPSAVKIGCDSAARTWAFGLTPTDRNFSAFTQIACPMGSIVVFARDPATASTSTVFVPSVVVRRHRRFQERIPASAVGRKLDLRRHPDGGRVGTVMLQSDNRQCAIDLGEEPDGRFGLFDGNAILLDFYAADDSAQTLWGIVEVKEPFEPGSIFTVNLAARAVIWRYHIVDGGAGRRSLQTADLVVEDQGLSADATASFEFVGGRMIDGSPAAVFQSKQPLALSDRPGDRFRLMLRGDGIDRHRRWSERLPFAGVSQIVRENDTSFADVFVYL